MESPCLTSSSNESLDSIVRCKYNGSGWIFILSSYKALFSDELNELNGLMKPIIIAIHSCSFQLLLDNKKTNMLMGINLMLNE